MMVRDFREVNGCLSKFIFSIRNKMICDQNMILLIFWPKCNFLILPEKGRKNDFSKFSGMKRRVWNFCDLME